MRESCFLKPKELAHLLGVSVPRIYQMLDANSLPSVRVGSRRFIPKPAWELWLAGQTEQALATVSSVAEAEREAGSEHK